MYSLVIDSGGALGDRSFDSSFCKIRQASKALHVSLIFDNHREFRLLPLVPGRGCASRHPYYGKRFYLSYETLWGTKLLEQYSSLLRKQRFISYGLKKQPATS
ncbi:hypothetical protein Rs2_26666 [Raphanus sativus]|nr:hypothetical protein Rs2_26666 [Raphanus sativus]